MGDWLKLKATDGHELNAYLAKPDGEARGGVVVVQEIFGVNKSIRGVADWLASEGFVAIAPATTDRVEPGLELGYSDQDLRHAFSIYPSLDPTRNLLDIAAAFDVVKGEGSGTAVLGFCYGGLLSWLSATRGPASGFAPACAVGYYAGGIGKVATEAPTCPVMLHFGGSDSHIGMDQVEAVRGAHPEVEVFVYEGAAHAFANLDRPAYSANAARKADERSLAFLKTHLG